MMLYGGGREGFLIMIKSQKKRERELNKAAKPRLRPCNGGSNAGAAQTKKGAGAAKTKKGAGAAQTKKGAGAAKTKKGGGRRSSGGGRRRSLNGGVTSTPAGNGKGGGEGGGRTPQKGGGRSAGRGGGGSGPPPPPPSPPPPPPPLPNPKWLLLCLQHVVNVRKEKGQGIDPRVMRDLNIQNPCTIHGLWPPSAAQVGNLNYVPFNQVLVAQLLNKLKSDWPSVLDPVSFATSLIFWAQQWKKHGRYCKMDLVTYMSKALNWFEMLKRVVKDSLTDCTINGVLDLVEFENRIMANGFGKPLVHIWMYDKKKYGKHVRRQFLKEIRFYSIFSDVAEVAYADFINPPREETTNYQQHFDDDDDASTLQPLYMSS